MHDLKAICERSSMPCRRDGTVIEIPSRIFGRLRVSRCCNLGGLCGELFVEQMLTGHEMPLHVLGREDPALADLCWDAYRMALETEGRGDAMLCASGIAPIVLDL